jgi:hypothetical protein
MKTFIKALLAASMLVPAAAQAQAQDGGRPWGGDRGGRPERPRPPGDARAAPPTPAPQPAPGDPGRFQGARPDFRAERPWQDRRDDRQPAPNDAQRGFDRSGGGDRGGWRDPNGGGGWRRPDGGDRPDRGAGPEGRQDWRDRPAAVDGRPQRAQDDAVGRDRRPGWDRGDAGARPPLAAGRPDWRGGDWNRQPNWDGARGGDRGAWNRGWRDDRRYDWGRYRASNRGAYRLPHYYAPSGWGYGYRRFSIGSTLYSGLWGSNYWIDDPWDYRLPEAYGPYRWVRYYDDALLVDLRSGRVVDVVYHIFF